MNDLQQFVIREYPLEQWASRQRDEARKEARIPSSAIFRGAVYQPILGARSVAHMDQLGRSPHMRACVGRYGSDTTWLSVLRAWVLAPTREVLRQAHRLLCARNQAEINLADGRTLRLGIVDGSDIGGHYFSVLTVDGEVEHVVDLEPSKGKGHELATTRRLLARMVAHEREADQISHIVGDGLYVNRPFFQYVHEVLGKHVIAKTKEKEQDEGERLEILESTQAAWSGMSQRELQAAGVEVTDFVDETRAIAYHVLSQAGITWEGLSFPVKVAWIHKTSLKGKRADHSVCYWVLTSDESLQARDLVSLGQDRWTIENNTFKELSEVAGSKRAYIKDAHAKEALLLMESLGLLLLKAFASFLSCQPAWKGWKVRKTKKLIAYCFIWDLMGFESSFSLAPP